MSKQKLELTWIGKEKRPRLEPRILLEDPALSYHAKQRVTEDDIFDNRLIFGDNLLALKALEQEFAGKVKCVFIDPPYNTGSAFTHYDDGLEHSIWLGLMRDRLEIIRRLMADDGSLWVTIDDNELHYLKVMCDEVFGRANFIANIVWQNRYSRSNDASISLSHNSILVYATDPEKWKKVRNRLARTVEQANQYKNTDNDPNGPWRAIPWDAPNIRPNLEYPINTPSGNIRMPPPGRHWSRTEVQWLEIVEAGLAFFGKNGDGAPAFKQYLKDAAAIVPNTWWPHEETGHTDEAKKEMHAIFGKDKAFDTPKPERLLLRIVNIATNPGDLVLDSFAGSGTTGAVAHKMGRRWIMCELGNHCHTHIIPRLQKVIDGSDKGGITETTGWQGGGGFRYYKLAPSLIINDRWSNPIVNPEYNAEQLAEALCKLEGFNYAPSETRWWQHGHSSERDYIYVTTQNLSPEQLQALADELGSGTESEMSLLVCCSAFHGISATAASERWPNLTLKKIPKMVLSRCEWGHDDYSLNVANLPMAESVADTSAPEPAATPTRAPKKAKKTDPSQPGLFEEGAE